MKPSVLIICSLLLSSLPLKAQTMEEEKQTIQQFLTNYYQTMSDRNWNEYREFFWDKSILTTIWVQPGDTVESVSVSTIDEFIAQTEFGPDSQPVFEEKMLNAEIDIQKNLASVWTEYEAKFGTEQNLMQWTGTDLFSLMKHDGEWKIVSLTFASDP